ncbi:MAG TPA: hypothetical protein VEC38_00610 [Candidatus Binataceae bacterium]|nr:hypothetical protein [Candidatus Binataceae bacterium]
MARMKLIAAAIAIALAALAGCTPDRAMDFGDVGEIKTPPTDQVSRDILRDFDGHDFLLGDNDRQAEVRLAEWAPGRRVIIPFWLGVNPLLPAFLRPTVGHIYVMSESILVRPLADNEHLIRAGSKLFKTDTLLLSTHTRYIDSGKMLPVVVRFVGTRVITVPRDAPATGTVTEKVPVLREVSLPMHIEQPVPGYAKFEVVKNPA